VQLRVPATAPQRREGTQRRAGWGLRSRAPAGAVPIKPSVSRISNTNREPIGCARSQHPTPGRVLTRTAPGSTLGPFSFGTFSRDLDWTGGGPDHGRVAGSTERNGPTSSCAGRTDEIPCRPCGGGFPFGQRTRQRDHRGGPTVRYAVDALSRWARQAPVQALAAAFLVGVIVTRRR
jgi:hypothetical protein